MEGGREGGRGHGYGGARKNKKRGISWGAEPQ